MPKVTHEEGYYIQVAPPWKVLLGLFVTLWLTIKEIHVGLLLVSTKEIICDAKLWLSGRKMSKITNLPQMLHMFIKCLPHPRPTPWNREILFNITFVDFRFGYTKSPLPTPAHCGTRNFFNHMESLSLRHFVWTTSNRPLPIRTRIFSCRELRGGYRCVPEGYRLVQLHDQVFLS